MAVLFNKIVSASCINHTRPLYSAIYRYAIDLFLFFIYNFHSNLNQSSHHEPDQSC